MASLKPPIYLTSFCLFVVLQLLSLATKPVSVRAGVIPSANSKYAEDIPEPAGPGTPSRTLPGGTYVRFEPPKDAPPTPDILRGPGKCPLPPILSPGPSPGPEIPTPPATALLPPTNFGLTYAAHPTFFIYVPPAAVAGNLILQDETGKNIDEIQIPLTEKAGVIAVTWPETAVPLEIGKNYRWFFVIVCNPKNPDNNRTVGGWIKRIEIEPNFQRKLDKATPLERAGLYAQKGIWFETLTTLANVSYDEPEPTIFVSEWQELLKSVGLESIAQMPLIKAQ